jgi:pyrroline-5-carboxylate reductase
MPANVCRVILLRQAQVADIFVRNQQYKGHIPDIREQCGDRQKSTQNICPVACRTRVSSCIVTTMNNTTLTFIGGGNMAGSLIGGLIADGWDPACIRVADTSTQRLRQLSEQFAITTTTSNSEAAVHADVIVLAVKPQIIKSVTQEIAGIVSQQQPLIISIAAGIPAAALGNWLGKSAAIVRTMPNTPALVQSGATALYASTSVTEEQRSIAESILRSVGVAIWVDDEAQMDAVTALSGSGPAYFFLFMEALQRAGQEMGLAEDTARLLVLQTAFGAAKMALESNEDAATLRLQVTSPGGTTEHAIDTFQAGGFQVLVSKALQAAAERSRELAEKFGHES